MSSSSFLHRVKTTGRRLGRSSKTLARNRYFWMGLGGLMGVALLLYILFNHLIMPAFTRHDVAIQVPSVTEMPYTEAVALLEERDLRAERVTQRFNPALPRDVVIDQSPDPAARVKPGRRIYLTVNTGAMPVVTIPPVEGMSLREAQNRLQAVGLKVADTRPDSIPSPYRNTVTRQRPPAGDSLPEGSSVTLWYSTGLGESYVLVPDVTGLTAAEAQETLLRHKLRSVVVQPKAEDDEPFDQLGDPVVVRQSRDPGTRVREGFEVRLFVGEEDEDTGAP